MKKITSLLILALGVTTLFAQENPMFLYTQGLSAEIPVTRSSDNNRYFVGCFNGDALLYDYQTGNVFQNVYDVTANFYEFKAVSNDGVVVGSYGYSLDDMVPMTFTNGTATALSDKGIPSYYYGCANSISADGRTIGGFIDFGGNLYHPIVWIDNVASILEYPNIDQYGETPSGAIVDHVNADGTVIVGRYYTNNYDEIGISWILNPETNSYEANIFSAEINFNLDQSPDDFSFHTRTYVDFTTGKLSGNGRYLIATYVTPYAQFVDHRYPIVFDLENNTYVLYEGFDDVIGIGVSNSGIVTVATPFLPTPHRDTYVYLPNDHTNPILFEDYIENTFSYSDFPYDILATSGTLVISNDGTTFYGYARGTYTTDLINLYFAPTEATSTPEVTLKENLQLQSTIITDGILNILTEVKSARIIDTTGRIIMQVENNNSINISAIASGLYIIEATDMNNNSATSRFVKR